jgi:NhaP-type Na+/H+ or K+/H+ antiporter
MSFFISILSFKEKGILLNNAYLYASKREREKMNKKPYYIQSAIVFVFIGLIFLLNGLQMLFKFDWLFYIVLVMMAITVVYAIASSIVIEKNKKSSK